MRLFSRLISDAADLIYPRPCPICGIRSDRANRYLCWSCFSSISWYQAGLCEVCGGFFGGEPGHRYICSACASSKPVFSRARAAARFNDDLQKVIHSFKYRKAMWLCEDLTDILEGCLRVHFETARIDAVVPVPLFHARERERGYNQSELLAEALASRIDRRCAARALRRICSTVSQTGLTAVKRRRNVKGVFEVVDRASIYRRRVLLVDDVMTTGATLNACAEVLKKNGAAEIWAVACARSSIGEG